MSMNRPYLIPEIPFVRLRCVMASDGECRMPRHKGSMLRGAFGHALRRTVCVMGPGQACEPCMLRRQCIYPRLFETFVDKDPPRFLRGLPTAPRPYLFEPFDTRAYYGSGTMLQFDLILLGQAVELYPYAIYAVEQMGSNGFGQRRHRFTLQRVDCETDSGLSPLTWKRLYDGKTRKLLSDVLVQTPLPSDPHGCNGGAQLHFETPTRLKFKNELTMDFTFRMLVFKMLRRVLELAHFHVPDATVDWEFHHLLVAADQVDIAMRDLRWVDWQRHSNRQNASMKMGGFTGTLVLQGALSPFLQLLQTSELVHVGKAAVFGNGKMSMGASNGNAEILNKNVVFQPQDGGD